MRHLSVFYVHPVRYDEVVTFLDPITKYSNVQGYMFNIKMLKSGAPGHHLHQYSRMQPQPHLQPGHPAPRSTGTADGLVLYLSAAAGARVGPFSCMWQQLHPPHQLYCHASCTIHGMDGTHPVTTHRCALSTPDLLTPPFAVFDPLFELHDIKQTAPHDITTRWTMTMKFTPADKVGLGRWWSPVITFTGR
jgi:hypothetical protein